MDAHAKKVLIIDDDPSFREMLKLSFENEGYNTFELSSGDRAIELLNSVDISLITLDIVMEGKEGVETAVEIMNSHPDVPVIAISGYKEYLDIISPFVKDTSSKPVDFRKLMPKIKEMLH